MPRITTIKYENGDYRLTGHAGRDLAFAVLNDHYCDNRSCDIQVALNDADCPFTAAYLLSGATECETVNLLWEAYRFNGKPINLSEPADWDTWVAYHKTHGVECECGSFTYGDGFWMPSTCENCGHDLPTTEDDE